MESLQARPLGTTGITVSSLGLGASRLGSLLTGDDRHTAERAVAAAWDAGIRFFDTANIYGQGDSEHIIGRVLGRAHPEAIITTKAGYVLPAPAWVLRLAKIPMRLVAARRGPGRGKIAATRARGYPQNFSPAHLSGELTASLRRLQREQIDIFMLHNPPPEEAAREELWRFVETEQKRGRIRVFAVSCAGNAEDHVWLNSNRVGAVQIPLSAETMPQAQPFLTACRNAGVGIVAREILGGPVLSGPSDRATRVADALRTVLSPPEVSVALIGSTSPQHIRDNAAIARKVISPVDL